MTTDFMSIEIKTLDLHKPGNMTSNQKAKLPMDKQK